MTIVPQNGRFGHDANPVTDFRTEVERIQYDVFAAAHQLPGSDGSLQDPERLRRRIDRAMDFVVGAVPEAVVAKNLLRHLAGIAVDETFLVGEPGFDRTTPHSKVRHVPSGLTWEYLGERGGGQIILREVTDGIERRVVGFPRERLVPFDYVLVERIDYEGMPEMTCEPGDVLRNVVGGIELVYLGILGSRDYPLSVGDHVLRRSDGLVLNLPPAVFRAAEYDVVANRSEIVSAARRFVQDNRHDPATEVIDDLLRLLVPPDESDLLQ